MNTTNIASQDFVGHVIARLIAAGKTAQWMTVRKTMIALAAKLQEGYTGRLQTMVPTDGGNASMSTEKRLALYVWQVMDICQKHNRTSEQVNAALDTIMGQAS